jgi:hypothetical protein
MNPEDFMVLAVKLSSSHGEAERRSAISRAYYGLFHSARLIVDACDVLCPESAEAHDKVTRCLQNSGDASLVAAGRELSSLRSIRNHADYRLLDARFTDGRFIQIQLTVARHLLTVFANAKADVAPIRTAVRKYAKETLKLRLRGNA